jgi:hypothetical protein
MSFVQSWRLHPATKLIDLVSKLGINKILQWSTCDVLADVKSATQW